MGRVPPQPYLRFDRNDYSLDPRLAGQRVELRVSQRELVAVALDTGELCARHPRVFAGGLAFTDPDPQRALERLRGRAPSAARARRRAAPAGPLRARLDSHRSIVAIALGIRACLAGQRVAFATATEWVARLGDPQHQGALETELRRLSFVPLIVVDEVGYG